MKKFFLSNCSIDVGDVKNTPLKNFVLRKFGEFSVLAEEDENTFESASTLGFFDGYIRDLDLGLGDGANISGNILLNEYKNWPPRKEITGSFSSFIIDKDKKEVILLNDLFGLYPLYYFVTGGKFMVSNSIIVMGMLSGAPLDEVGIIQRSLGPEHANIGRRTILKGCCRLLPGEWIRFDEQGEKIDTRFDNSLYQEISTPDHDQVQVEEYWEILKREVAYCLNSDQQVDLALSGGIDSRIILGSIPREKQIVCHTFGGKENYETKIASRLAKKVGAEFNNYEDLSLYFPSNDLLKEYTFETEALYLGSWLEILENVKPSHKQAFITGDLTTALTGRNIVGFASKEFKRKNFFKFSISKGDYDFTPNTPTNFEKWKGEIGQKYLKYYNLYQLDKFKFKIDCNTLLSALYEDLEWIYKRIEDHNLPYIELCDELFMWYTHTRTKSAKQVLICANKFKTLAPAMGVHVLRAASNIHPNQRLDLKFINHLFRSIPELKKLARLPTSQAPLVPANSPNFIKFSMWGIRSMGDNFFIKRLIKNKDPEMRYRLFKSINWLSVYQNPQMEKYLDQYFIEDHIGEGLVSSIKNQCIYRKRFQQWPFSNMEVLSVASLNAELEFINDFRN